MRVYLVASTSAPPIPPRFAEAVRACTEHVLFPESEPWQSRQWTSGDGRTQLLAWCNEPDDARLLPPLLADDERAVGCPGYLGDPRDLERLFRAEDLGTSCDQLPGVFGAFRAHQHGFAAVTTYARFHPVYHAAAGELHLAGNRALLVHLVERLVANPSLVDAASAVRYDISSLQSLVRNGFFVSDDTPFDGVQALPPHSTLEVLRGVRRIVRRPIPAPELDGDGSSVRVRGSLIRDLTDSVVKAVAPLRAFSEPITLQLTGGRDSRLIAAALHAADIPFCTTTVGVPEHPDVVLAARISELLGARHRISSPQKPSGDDLRVKHPLLRAWEMIRATEGMVAVHNNVTLPQPFRIAPMISGWGGEQLRGGYLALLFKKSTSVPQPAEMRRKLNNLFTGLAGFLTDAANERARSDLARWVDRPDPDAALLLDHAYLYYRTGRWVSAFGGAKWATSNPSSPLLDNLLTRYILAIPPLVRWSEQPVHKVISRLAPRLRDLPLQGARWRYEERKPPGLFARRGWSSRSALSVVTERASFDWRFQPSPLLVGILREQIMDSPSQLFDIVKRSEIEALLSTSPLESAKLVWHAYTASVLLSNVWLSTRPNRSPITIRPPK